MPARTLRCLTLNLWGVSPPLGRRLRMVEEALATLRPDVVALQEVQELPGAVQNTAQTLAAAAGLELVFAPTVAVPGGHEGLALLSRAAIETHSALELPHARPGERRILLSARLATQAGPIWVHNTHLNYRPHHGREREDQVVAIDGVLRACEPENPQILMGDFNARPDADEIRWLKGLTTIGGRRTFLQDVWETTRPGEPGWTWASRNPQTHALAFLALDRRLDYIFTTVPRQDGRGRVMECRLVLDDPAPDGAYASDHFGLFAEIQIEATGNAGSSPSPSPSPVPSPR